MRQIVQELRSGRTQVLDVPAPQPPRDGVCIVTRCSLVSSGTERMLVEFARGGWLDKVRQQPDKARAVVQKIGTDGLLATLEAVRSKLDQALPLGYCNVGVVLAAGSDVSDLRVGDRVASNGPHAQLAAVGRNLCARIPDAVQDESAAFTVIGAVGLQGLRLLEPSLGESVAVIGLGLIGLITVQILRANGCRVLGMDPDPARTALARRFGATTVELSRGEDPVRAAEDFSRGRGVDGVLIAAATPSDEPVSVAARMCRRRGRIVLIGVAGLQLSREEFYRKELSFQVSCSYGPGRYDPQYEVAGHDYPVGFVRWTEQRNFEAMLDLMAAGSLDLMPLISHRFALDDAQRAYELLLSDSEPHLGILISYPEMGGGEAAARSIALQSVPSQEKRPGVPALLVIGSGNYARRILMPALARTGAQLVTIASNGGLSAAHLARKYGFAEATTDTASAIRDSRTNAAVIATRHDSHARLVCEALRSGKHVFVEKPLAISQAEIDQVQETWSALPEELRPLLMVGFNRRFAPLTLRMKQLLECVSEPKTFIVSVNAGSLPADHWTQDAAIGGGRIIGEGCHFIDLMRFLSGAAIERWHVTGKGPLTSITLTFADGSLGTLHYLTNGHPAFPKERVEVFCGGRMLQLDNFRKLRAYGWKGFGGVTRWRQDKGHAACAAAFVTAIRNGGGAPIPPEELLEVARVTVAVGEAAR